MREDDDRLQSQIVLSPINLFTHFSLVICARLAQDLDHVEMSVPRD